MDLQEMINRMSAAAGAPAAAGGAPGAAPGATPAAPVGIMNSPLFMPAVVGLIAYFGSDKDWKWAAGAAAAALFLKR